MYRIEKLEKSKRKKKYIIEIEIIKEKKEIEIEKN